jgi:hypothetical protein
MSLELWIASLSLDPGPPAGYRYRVVLQVSDHTTLLGLSILGPCAGQISVKRKTRTLLVQIN